MKGAPVDDRDIQALTAVKLYYERDLSQAEIAAELGVSRPTVSKLIQYAQAKGYVTITIHDPREASSELAEELAGRFGLKQVHLVRPATAESADLLQELGKAGAEVLVSLVQDGQSVGVSWGNTMFALAEQLPHTNRQGVEIVQLKGGHSHSQASTNDYETITKFCTAFNASAQILPLPVIFDNVAVKLAVEQDRHIAQVLRAGRETDVVVFTVGSATADSLPMTLGYLRPSEETELLEKAVGDACSRFYTAGGELALPEIDARTVGISLEDLARRPVRLLVAGGIAKAQALKAALSMGLASHLVVDERTAQRVLELEPEG